MPPNYQQLPGTLPNYGIEVLDIADPAHPREVDEYGSVNGAHSLYVDGGLVYIAEGMKGLIILEFREDEAS